MPLYYWFKDTAANQWNGQSVGKVWWVVTPNGRFVTKPLPHYASLAAGKTPYGDILVGNGGKAVYMFTKDADGQSVCYDECATIWPPVLSDVQVFTGAGIDPKLIGTVARKDGTKQVTFNGMPLYYYWEDAAPGDLKGQNFNSIWFVLRPSGEVLRPG
jgi:predicted lipoprotein with Yx(FWY)xxD motif